jgi:alpha-glucosidase (family GH31 glycosyl hydrolase)
VNRVAAATAWVATLVLVAASPAGAAVDRTVTSGPLRATVTAGVWSIDFAQAAGASLEEASTAGAGRAGGPLGFSDGALWHEATLIVSERRDGAAYVATLATDTPLNQIEVRVAPAGDGVISLRALVTGAGPVAATGTGFRAGTGERFLGFGERSNAVNQRGLVVDQFVADGPYQPEERPFITAFVPPQGFGDRDDSTYFPMPWLLSTRGYGFLLDNAQRSRFRLATGAQSDRWSVDADARELRFRVFAGPRPAGVLRRLTETLGKQPPAAAPWYFGPWFQPAHDDLADVQALRKAGAPASVIQTYTHYLPCGAQQGAEAAQRRRTDRMHAEGLAITTYFNPMLCTSYQPVYDQAVAAGVLTKNALGQPYQYRYTGASQFLVGQFDFSAPGANAFFGKLLGEAVSHGYDGWMEDFGEYTPSDSSSSDGTAGPAMHNLYPALYHRAAREYAKTAPRPLARFNRSGWTGAARESQIVWGGDPTTDWGFDGLASAVKQGLSMGLSGVSVWGSDIGGFFALGTRMLTPELLARWVEVGFVSGVMRTEANGSAIPEKGARPQIFDAAVLPVWRRYAKLRTQLYPYLAAADRRYQETGLPIMSHLALAYPDDTTSTAVEDEFLFGPDILAAPVVAEGARERRLYLPEGDWVDLWRSAGVDGETSALDLGGVRVLGGGHYTTVRAPLDEVPLFVRVGAVLALLPPDVQTLTDYGSGVVHMSDRRSELRLLAFPRGRATTSLGKREWVRSTEGRREWRLKFTGRRRRVYRIQASLATLARPYRPCAIRVGKRRRLSRRAWSYDATTRVLRARVKLRSGTVTMMRRCRRASASSNHEFVGPRSTNSYLGVG